MASQTLAKPKKPRQSKNGNGVQPRPNGSAEYAATRQDWPLDYGAAYRRQRGPYTICNATVLVAEEPLEIFNGWLVWQPMTNPRERGVAGNILEILSLVARSLGFGQAYPDQLECVMLNEDVYKPDVCVISHQRFEKQVDPVEPGREHEVLRGSPELVVEIRSPSNRRTQERKKRKVYFDNGAVVIWDIDHLKRTIWVYQAGNNEKGREYSGDEEISCEQLLPGWKRKVGDFFGQNLSAESIVGDIADRWRAESRAEGEAVGRAEGELAAWQKIILLQAQARFGKEVPPDLEAQLAGRNLAELTLLAASLATASSPADWLSALPN